MSSTLGIDFKAIKEGVYDDYGAGQTTPFFQKKEQNSFLGLKTSEKITPGFFNGFENKADFVSQIKKPLLMPVACVTKMLEHTLKAFSELYTSAVNLMTLDTKQAKSFAQNGLKNLYVAARFLLSFVVDTLRELAAFTSRSLSTGVEATGRGFKALGNKMGLFASQDKNDKGSEEVYSSQQSYPAPTSP